MKNIPKKEYNDYIQTLNLLNSKRKILAELTLNNYGFKINDTITFEDNKYKIIGCYFDTFVIDKYLYVELQKIKNKKTQNICVSAEDLLNA